MSGGIITWSQTAATNATADPNVNMAEGMAPSALNDGIRALMASGAKWRDDHNGSILTSGTSTSYTLSTNQVFAALTSDYDVYFCPHTTNGATVTINVDALGAKPLRAFPGSAGEIPAGVLVMGTPYGADYKSTNGGEWILKGLFGNPYNTPIGGGMIYLGTTAPNASFVLPYGQAISRTTYSALFAMCSTNFGSGDGATTFNVIDLRTRIPVGWDGMGGSGANRVTSTVSGIDGATIGATGGVESVTLTASTVPSGIVSLNDPGHSHTVNVYNVGAGGGGAAEAQIASVVATPATSTNSTNITLTDHGGNLGHNNMPPAVVVPWIVRII